MTMNLSLVTEWEHGLPKPDELTPLSQGLIPQELASAFNIPHSSSPSTCTVATPSSSDVLNASQSALESLLHMRSVLLPTLELDEEGRCESAEPKQQRAADVEDMAVTRFTRPLKEINDQSECAPMTPEGKLGSLMAGGFKTSSLGLDAVGHTISSASIELHRVTGSFYNRMTDSSAVDVRLCEEGRGNGDGGHGVAMEAASLMQLRLDPSEEVDSGPSMDALPGNPASLSSEEQSARTLKKPRLVWTPQLHKRFVDAVAHLGIKNAVPKTIMQLMNVEGLTRENVASHLQKYRLYLKRMQGLPTDSPSSSDHLFATTPVPSGLTASAHFLGTHQHADYRFATAVPGVNLPNITGSRGHHLMNSPIPSFSSFDARNSFSSLARAPSHTLLRSEQMREAYNQHSSSPTGGMLTLFPTSGS